MATQASDLIKRFRLGYDRQLQFDVIQASKVQGVL